MPIHTVWEDRTYSSEVTSTPGMAMLATGFMPPPVWITEIMLPPVSASNMHTHRKESLAHGEV